jgi:hypothetical protein
MKILTIKSKKINLLLVFVLTLSFSLSSGKNFQEISIETFEDVLEKLPVEDAVAWTGVLFEKNGFLVRSESLYTVQCIFCGKQTRLSLLLFLMKIHETGPPRTQFNRLRV